MRTRERLTTAERARGRWRLLLLAAGFREEHLNRKNGPCPFCGGEDRWEFLDRGGSGSWICRKCGPAGHGFVGNGFEALKRRFGTNDYATVAKWVDGQLPGNNLPPREMSQTDARDRAKWTWEHASPLRDGDKATTYLRSRKIELSVWPTQLRTRNNLLLAKIISPANEAISVHVRDLTKPGKWRSMRGSYPAGSAIRLAKALEGVLGIAEGVETALSASLIFGVPVWSVISASGIEAFKPPPDATTLIIFADNDPAGRLSAATAFDRLHATLDVRIEMPKDDGADWNDVLMGKAK